MASAGTAASVRFPLSASDIQKWLRFALKGGIGTCVAINDKMAEEAETLMFLQGDVIIILQEIQSLDNGYRREKQYFAFCEGVLGLVSSEDVLVQGKLKRPVFTRKSKEKKIAQAEEGFGLGLGLSEEDPSQERLHPRANSSTENEEAEIMSPTSINVLSPTASQLCTPLLDYSPMSTPSSTPMSIVQPSTPPPTLSTAQNQSFGSPSSDNGDLFDLYRRSTIEDVQEQDTEDSGLGHPLDTSPYSMKAQHDDSAAEHLGYLMADLSSTSAPAKVSPRKLSYNGATSTAHSGLASQLRRQREEPSYDTNSDNLSPMPYDQYETPTSSLHSLQATVYTSSAVDVYQGTDQANPDDQAALQPGFRFPPIRTVCSPEHTARRPAPIKVRSYRDESRKSSLQPSSPALLHPSYYKAPDSATTSRSSIDTYATAFSMPPSPQDAVNHRKGSLPSRSSADSRRQYSPADRWHPRFETSQLSYSQEANINLQQPSSKPSTELVRSGSAGQFELVQPVFTFYSTSGDNENEKDPAVWKPDMATRAHLRRSMMIEAESTTCDGRMSLSTTRPSRDSGRSSNATSPRALKATAGYRQKEAKWLSIIGKKSGINKKGNKALRKLVRSGIPSSVRGKAWAFLVGVEDFRKDGIFYDLSSRDDTPISTIIEKDLDHLYESHPLFQGSSSPYRSDMTAILRAYAVIQSDLYQIVHPILAAFLLHFCPAEDAFWLLVTTTRRLGFLQQPRSISSRRLSFVLSQLLEISEPKIAGRLSQANIGASEWVENWVLPLFLQCLPLATAVRVFDIILFEGDHFVMQVCLAIFDLLRDQLLDPATNLHDMIKSPPEDLLDPHAVLATAFTTKVSESAVKRLDAMAKKQR